jgi:hypothetical protein
MDSQLLDSPSSSALVWRAVGVVFCLALARFFYRLHEVRTLVRRYHKQHGLVCTSLCGFGAGILTASQELIPHSYLLGHLVVTGKIMARYPRDMFPISVCTLMLQQFPHLEKNGFILLDAWPFIDPMLYVFDPEMSTQFTQVQSLPKSTDLKSEFWPLTGTKDLVTSDGPEWKFWRSVFNPGFSAKNLMSMTPAFLEEVRVFVGKLREAAKSGEVLKIEGPATSLTIDVIARTTLCVPPFPALSRLAILTRISGAPGFTARLKSIPSNGLWLSKSRGSCPNARLHPFSSW